MQGWQETTPSPEPSRRPDRPVVSFVRLLPLAGALAGLLGAPLATPLAAQGRPAAETVTLPRELLLALLGNANPRDSAALAIGRVPVGLPAELASSGVEVLGGVSYPVRGDPRGVTRDGRRGTALLVLAEPGDRAVAAVAASLERAGWRRPQPPSPMQERGGFVPAIVPPRLATLCRDDAAIALAPSVRQAGGSFVRATLMPVRQSACDPTVAARSSPYFEAFPFPPLVAPAGVTSHMASGRGGGDDRREAYTRLQVDMTPEALVAHYAAQLERAGWTLGAAVQADGVALRSGSARDPQGRTWHGVLTAQRIGDGPERDVTLRVVRPGAPR